MIVVINASERYARMEAVREAVVVCGRFFFFFFRHGNGRETEQGMRAWALALDWISLNKCVCLCAWMDDNGYLIFLGDPH